MSKHKTSNNGLFGVAHEWDNCKICRSQRKAEQDERIRGVL
jgi:hypothetical protein